jgi:hypothetical protein
MQIFYYCGSTIFNDKLYEFGTQINVRSSIHIKNKMILPDFYQIILNDFAGCRFSRIWALIIPRSDKLILQFAITPKQKSSWITVLIHDVIEIIGIEKHTINLCDYDMNEIRRILWS